MALTKITNIDLENSQITGEKINSSSSFTFTKTTQLGYFAEKANLISTGFSSGYTYQLDDGPVHFHIADSSSNGTISLNGFSDVSVGNSVSVAVLVQNGADPKYISDVQIDNTGTGVTVKWSGGSSPTGGNTSNTDVYVFSVIKTSSSPTYNIFASQTQFGG
jgi:hypothetical protein